MTALQHTIDRIDRILKQRGYAPVTPQERELVAEMLEAMHWSDTELADALCLARTYDQEA